MLHYETVSPDCLRLLKQLMEIPALENFRLAGGTALALQKGHRISIDIDLFADKEFEPSFVLQTLEASLYPDRPEGVRIFPFGIFCFLHNVKVDFMFWGHPFVEKIVEIEGIRMASPLEIFAMKLHATSGRRTKKDFFDVALLLEELSLNNAIKVFEEKYTEFDIGAVIRQLTYFDDAENSAEPDMLIPLTWEMVKERISDAVRKYWDEQLDS